MEQIIKTRDIVDNLTEDEFAAIFYDRDYITSFVFSYFQSLHIDIESRAKSIDSQIKTLNEKILSLESNDDELPRNLSEVSSPFCVKSIVELPEVIIGAVGSYLNMTELLSLEQVNHFFLVTVRTMAPLLSITSDDSNKVFAAQKYGESFSQSLWNRYRNVRNLTISIRDLMGLDGGWVPGGPSYNDRILSLRLDHCTHFTVTSFGGWAAWFSHDEKMGIINKMC